MSERVRTQYDDMTIAEIIHDYAVIRGDLTTQYARDQLVKIIEARITDATADLERTKRGAETLGHIVEQNCRMILDITGLHDWIDEDGDGDWGAIWENAYSLRPKLEATEAEATRLTALVERHGPCICNTGPGTEGPEEYCPQHGRTYSDVLDVVDRIVAGERSRAADAESRARDLEIERNLLRTTLAETLAMLQELDAAWNKDGAK